MPRKKKHLCYCLWFGCLCCCFSLWRGNESSPRSFLPRDSTSCLQNYNLSFASTNTFSTTTVLLKSYRIANHPHIESMCCQWPSAVDVVAALCWILMGSHSNPKTLWYKIIDHPNKKKQKDTVYHRVPDGIFNNSMCGSGIRGVSAFTSVLSSLWSFECSFLIRNNGELCILLGSVRDIVLDMLALCLIDMLIGHWLASPTSYCSVESAIWVRGLSSNNTVSAITWAHLKCLTWCFIALWSSPEGVLNHHFMPFWHLGPHRHNTDVNSDTGKAIYWTLSTSSPKKPKSECQLATNAMKKVNCELPQSL